MMVHHISNAKDGRYPAADEITAVVQSRGVRPIFKKDGGVGVENLVGAGFTYRHDWGYRHGQMKLTLNWGAISSESRIFVSGGEFGEGGGYDVVRDARFTVEQVFPFAGGVTVWLNVEWHSDIHIRLDYLVINP